MILADERMAHRLQYKGEAVVILAVSPGSLDQLCDNDHVDVVNTAYELCCLLFLAILIDYRLF